MLLLVFESKPNIYDIFSNARITQQGLVSHWHIWLCFQFYPWNGNRRLAINQAFQDSDSVESNESSNSSDSDDSNSSSESDTSKSSESSGLDTSHSESNESALSEENFLITAEPEITSSITVLPPLPTEGHVTCFTLHLETLESRGDNF